MSPPDRAVRLNRQARRTVQTADNGLGVNAPITRANLLRAINGATCDIRGKKNRRVVPRINDWFADRRVCREDRPVGEPRPIIRDRVWFPQQCRIGNQGLDFNIINVSRRVIGPIGRTPRSHEGRPPARSGANEGAAIHNDDRVGTAGILDDGVTALAVVRGQPVFLPCVRGVIGSRVLPGSVEERQRSPVNAIRIALSAYAITQQSGIAAQRVAPFRSIK